MSSEITYYHLGMRLLENYKSSSGKAFSVSVRESFEPKLGDYLGLYFEIAPSLNKGDGWSCVIKVSGTMQAVWGFGRDNQDELLYKPLSELGLLKIKQAIEKAETFLDFMFTSYGASATYEGEVDKLNSELERLIKREPEPRSEPEKEVMNPSEIFMHNRELRKKILELHYTLSRANSYELVMRHDVAAKLGLNPNENVLMGVYKFLEDKHLLKCQTNVEDSITSWGIDEVEQGYPTLLPAAGKAPFQDLTLGLKADDFDSFEKTKRVLVDDVKKFIPLSYSEDNIQTWLEEVMSEPWHKKDWGGETNDLFTTLLVLSGTRKSAAFLLKGPGIKKDKLEISDCGKNGDQIQRLFDSPAEIFLIQFGGKVSEAVIREAQDKTLLLRHRGINAQYCILDGYDTARILKAYGKIS